MDIILHHYVVNIVLFMSVGYGFTSTYCYYPTQLKMTLGVDRDNELVAPLFNERNEAVRRMIQHVIRIAKKHHRKIGICGDAPSTYPEFAKFLVDCGIHSITLSSDALLKTRLIIAKHEKQKKRKSN